MVGGRSAGVCIATGGQVGFEVYRTDMIVDATNVVAGPDLAGTTIGRVIAGCGPAETTGIAGDATPWPVRCAAML